MVRNVVPIFVDGHRWLLRQSSQPVDPSPDEGLQHISYVAFPADTVTKKKGKAKAKAGAKWRNGWYSCSGKKRDV